MSLEAYPMTVGSYEAKTHFPSLLDRVSKGEEVIITKHGVPVARLVPIFPFRTQDDYQEIAAQIRQFRKGRRLGEVSVRQLIEEGRR